MKIDLPEMQHLIRVNGIVMQDILFVEEKKCIGCDLSILKSRLNVNDNNHLWDDTYSDMAITRFKEEYFKMKSNGEYGMSIPDYIMTSNQTSTARTIALASICGLTHTCVRGSGSACDVWKALCRASPDCGYQSAITFSAKNSLSARQLLDQVLPANKLYEFRDELNETLGGSIYVEGYYEMSNHFKNSLDFSISGDIISMSGDLNNTVNRYLNGSNEILLNESLFRDIVTIAKKSKINSDSHVYREIVDMMITQLSRYKNQTVTQVRTKLKTPKLLNEF